MILDILLTIFLVLLNGFFVAAEFAIVKVRSSQIELKVKQGNRMASLASHIIANMDSYLSATQLGITIASLGLGWIGESVVAKIIIGSFDLLGLAIMPALAHSIALYVAFGLITVLHIVFGELAPKSFAIQRPEQTTLWVAAPLNVFYWICRPVIFILNGFSNFTLRIMGITRMKEAVHSPEELKMMVEQGKKSGVIEPRKYEIIRNAFDFAERTARQAMVPRTNLFGIDKTMPMDGVINKILENGYSRVPVYEGTIDHIIGIIFTKDLLQKLKAGGTDLTIDSIIRPAHYVAANKKLIDIMRDFQKEHVQFAIVVDEFGGTEGVITMEDILEELVGEIQDEYDSETPSIERIDEKKIRALGSVTLVNLNEHLPRPLTENETYVTLAGMLIDILGRIPNVGENILYEGFLFTVIKRIKNQIILVDILDKTPVEDSEKSS